MEQIVNRGIELGKDHERLLPTTHSNAEDNIIKYSNAEDNNIKHSNAEDNNIKSNNHFCNIQDESMLNTSLSAATSCKEEKYFPGTVRCKLEPSFDDYADSFDSGNQLNEIKMSEHSGELGNCVIKKEVENGNGFSELEYPNNVIGSDAIKMENHFNGSEISPLQSVFVKQELKTDLLDDLMLPKDTDKNCIYCSQEKHRVDKQTLNSFKLTKTTSLKRNRSDPDIYKRDDDHKVCSYCHKKNVSSRSKLRQVSQSSSGDGGQPKSASSISDLSDSSPRSARNLRKKHKGEMLETDPVILARRQKQIDYGKNTTGYKRYQELVPKYRRSHQDPATPPKLVKYSRRGWDGLIKAWRRRLHNWDPPRNQMADGDDDSSFLSESPVPTVSDDSEIATDTKKCNGREKFSWASDVEPEDEENE